jgi:hypothetical protein
MRELPVIAVACEAPARLQRPPLWRPSRLRVAVRALTPALLIFGVPFLMSLTLPRPRRFTSIPETDEGVAQITIAKLVHEGYPQWAHDHGLGCPSSVRDLLRYDNIATDLDPWGVPYMMTCNDQGIVIHSRGPDRVDGTTDDIWSDRR